MNDVIPFRFESAQVRALTIDGEPWFVASDIAEVLDYGHTPHMTRMLDEDEKGVHNVDTLGGEQKLTTINESGLYSAILRSRKPEAKVFRKWITGVLLPCLRKTGRYEAPNAKPKYADALAILDASENMVRLLSRIRHEPTPEARQALHLALDKVCSEVGAPTPPLEALEASAIAMPAFRPRQHNPVAAEAFWQAIAKLEDGKYRLDHSRDPGRAAYNLPQVRALADAARVRLPASRRELRDALYAHPRFVGVIPVNSGLTGRTVKCWVFSRESTERRMSAHRA